MGRQADGFQFYVDSLGPSTLSDFSSASGGLLDATGKSIIGGGQIHDGNGLPVIWIDPNDDGPPKNGGWGPTATNLSFDLSGMRLTFDASFHDLQDDDELFWYHFQTVTYGGTTCVNHPSTPLLSGQTYTSPADICGSYAPNPGDGTVPLPAAAWLLLSALAGLGAMVRRKPH